LTIPDVEEMGWECRGLDPHDEHPPGTDFDLSSVERGTTDRGDLEVLVGNDDVPMIPYIAACIIEDFANTLDYIAVHEPPAHVARRLSQDAMHRASKAFDSYI
jgi:hypothetical protein